MRQLVPVLAVGVLMATGAGSAAAQGACSVQVESTIIYCIDDLASEGECDSVPGSSHTWSAGETCAEKNTWHGACAGPNVDVPGHCALVVSSQGKSSAESYCESLPATWVLDAQSCEGLPTLPVTALLTLGVALLAGGSLLLRRGSPTVV